MKKNILFFILALGGIAWSADALTIKINNQRAKGVYIQPNKAFLTDSKETQLTANTSVSLSSGTSVYSVTPIDGARIYFSVDGTKLPDGSSHSPIQSQLKTIRYDYVELSPDGTPTACANLSSVDQFGFCITLKTYKNGNLVSSSGWNKSANDIKDILKALSPSAYITNGSDFIRVTSPSHLPDAWPGMSDSFSTVANKTIVVAGYFNGVKGGAPAAAYNLTGTFDGSGTTVNFTDNTSQSGAIVLTIAGINTKSIYSASEAGCTISGSMVPSGRAVNANDLIACVFRDTMTGFNAGFWTSSKPQTSKTYNWSQNNEFLSGSSYNKYSNVFFVNTDSYGDPYSDREGNKVLIDLAPAVADTLEITLLPDDAAQDYNPNPPYFLASEISPQPLSITPGLQQIVFNDDPKTAMPYKDRMPVNFSGYCKLGDYNKVSFVFNGAALKDSPYVNVYLPDDLIDNPTTVKKKPPFKIPSGWGKLQASDLLFWSPVPSSDTYWNLVLTSNLKPSNFTSGGGKHKPTPGPGPGPSAGKCQGYQIVGQPSLKGVIFGEGAKMVSASQGQAMFSSSTKQDCYIKLSLVFDTTAKAHPYIWVYVSSDPKKFDPSAHPINCSGWHLPNTKNNTTGMFEWMNIDTPPVIWKLQLSGDVKPANFNAKNASKTAPKNGNQNI